MCYALSALSTIQKDHGVKRTLLFLFITSLFFAAQAERYYVVLGTEGDGSSWDKAFGTLQEALEVAQVGDQIWLASGEYLPSYEGDRNAAFSIPNGVELYGGFAGDEKKLTDRDPVKNPTILSGEIGDPASTEDNSYTIVYFYHASPATLIDGLTLANGMANGYADGADLTTCGGAIYNYAEGGTSSPTIQNCVFLYNSSREGAAIYNYANEGDASPAIRDCKFLYNRSDFNGGAIFNDGNFGLCNPSIENCRFEGNESTYGAGILNQGLYGECKPTITNCHFYDNFSLVRGGAIYNLREGRGDCEALVDGCVFEENGSTVGEDVDNTFVNDRGTGRDNSGIQLRDTAISY